MTTRKKPASFDWQGWTKTFGAPLLALLGMLIAFYFSTNATLTEHSKQFAEVKEQFKQFNETLKKNYSDWAAQTKADAEKAERKAEVEKLEREKLRDNFLATFKELGTTLAKLQVDIAETKSEVKGQNNAINQQLNTIIQHGNERVRGR